MKTHLISAVAFAFVSLLAALASAQWVRISPQYQYNASVLSVAQRDSLVFSGMSAGVYVSHNSGTNWAPSGLTRRSVQSILIFDTRVIAGTDSGVFISTDNAAVWSLGGLANYSVKCLWKFGALIFAGTFGGGVFLSVDSGTTWNQTGLTDGVVYSLGSIGSKLLATVHVGPQWNIFYTSTDTGRTWAASDSGLGTDGIGPILVDGDRVYVGVYGGVYESVDSTKTWTEATTKGFSGKVACLAKSGGNLIAGTDSYGVKYSTDGGSTWNSTNLNYFSNLPNSSAYEIFALSGSGSTIFAGTAVTGIFRSTDNGIKWYGYGLSSSAVKSLFRHDNFLFQTSSGGVFRSSDYGNTWSPADNGMNWPGVSALASNDSGIYAAGFTEYGGLYRSTDDGDSWTQLFADRQFYCLDANDSIILAGGPAGTSYDGGLFVSTDDGKSWTMAIDRGQSGVNSVAIGDTNLFATDLSNRGIFVSTDGGKTFSSQDSGSCIALIGRTIYVASFYNSAGLLSRDNGRTWARELSPGNVYAMAVSHDTIFAATDRGIFASADSGVTWGDVAIGLESISFRSIAVLGGYVFAGSTNGTIWRAPLSEISIVPLIHPTLLGPPDESTVNTDSVTCSWTTVPEATDYLIEVAYDSSFQDVQFDNFTYKKTSYQLTGLDNGATCYWRVRAYQVQHPGPWSPVRTFHVATDTLHNGRTWSLTGYLGSPVGAFATNDSVILAGTMGGGIFRSTDDGNTWIHSSTGLTSVRVSSLASDSTDIFAGTVSDSGGVFRSTDNGRTWSLIGLRGREIAALALSGKVVLASVESNMSGITISSGGLFMSTDDGSSWVQAVNRGQSWMNSVVISDSLIFATDEVGQDVFISTDRGTRWTSRSVFAYGGREIAVVGHDVYAGASGQFGGYRSTDEGKSWAYVGSSGPNFTVSALLSTDDILFAAAPIYFSHDAGLTWSDAALGLKDSNYVVSLAAKDNYLFAGSIGGHVWRVSIPAILTSVHENKPSVPSKFELFQNYPNPFNPTTVIRFDVPSSGFVSLKIYNVLGQLVKTLVDKVESPGSHAVVFNDAGIASGVYFYRIVADGTNGKKFVAVKKLMLIK